MIKAAVYSEDEAYARAVSLGLMENRDDVYVNIVTERDQLWEANWDVRLELDEYCSLGEILEYYDAQLDLPARRALPCSPSCRLIGVSSAYGGMGQSTVCRALGGLLSAGFQKRVLYIDLSGRGEGFLEWTGAGADPDEILYRITCEDRDPRTFESSLVKDEYGLMEFPWYCGFTPAAYLTESEADSFVRSFAACGMFDAIILDTEYRLPDQRFFARMCEENVLLKPAFEYAPVHDFYEAWLRTGLGSGSRRRLHVVDLSQLGRCVAPDDSDIYSELGALLLPLAEELAGRMQEL